MWLTGVATRRVVLAVTVSLAVFNFGCKTTVKSHPPVEKRIERMQAQVRQMEGNSSAEKGKAGRTTQHEVRE